MKKLILIVFALSTIGATTLVVVFNPNLRDIIIKSFTKGDVETLSTCFTEDVFLELFDKEEYNDLRPVKDRLRTFFEAYPPKYFKIKHESSAAHKKNAEEVFRVNISIEEEKIKDISIIFETPIN